MLEKIFRTRICNELRACNAIVLPIIGGVASGYKDRAGVSYAMEAGMPDIFCAHKYWSGFIEFKGEKTRLTTKQKDMIAKLNKRSNILAIVCRCVDIISPVSEKYRIENEKGELLGVFHDGLSLVKKLAELKGVS